MLDAVAFEVSGVVPRPPVGAESDYLQPVLSREGARDLGHIGVGLIMFLASIGEDDGIRTRPFSLSDEHQ